MSFFFGYVPMEFFMYGAIGFLAAWLMALMCFPAVHHRAQRLLRKRYDELPLSIQEMRAEKDQIRAGFATATRDLEVSIGKLKEKTAAHATEIARKAQLIERLKQELEQANAALEQSLGRERDARDELRATPAGIRLRQYARLRRSPNANAASAPNLREARRELALKDSALDAAEQEVAAIKSEISRIAPLLQLPTSLMTPRSAEIVPLAPVSALPSARTRASRRTTASCAPGPRSTRRRAGSMPAMTAHRCRSRSTNQHLRATYAPASKPVS